MSNKYMLFVIAFFHDNTLRSGIDKFTDEESAKKWLLEEWKFLLQEPINEESITLDELMRELRDAGLCLEMLKWNITPV